MSTPDQAPTIKYRRGYKYQLVEDVVVPVPDDMPEFEHQFFVVHYEGAQKVLRIRAGYAWDGMSGGAVDSAGSMFPSLVHDVGCQATDEGLLGYEWRAWFDNFFSILLRANMSTTGGRVKHALAAVRASYARAAVRWYSRRNEARRAPKSVLEAPAVLPC